MSECCLNFYILYKNIVLGVYSGCARAFAHMCVGCLPVVYACVCVYVYGECVSVVCVCMLACVRVYVCECVRDRTEYQQQGKQIRSRWGGLGVEGID